MTQTLTLTLTQENLTLLSTTSIVLSGLCLVVGWYFVRWRKVVRRHKRAMVAATAFAALFLVAYVTRWSLYESKAFAGGGAWRLFYYANLLPHIVLAIAVGPMALRLIYLAVKKRDFNAHRRLGRITVPVWLYVAASGWLIYYMLHHMAS